MGQGVKLLMKGKVSAFLGPVEEHFSPVHASMSASCLEEITPGSIGDKVRTGGVLFDLPAACCMAEGSVVVID